MGCTASKLDNEDTVRRCKERRRLIKAAVYARHHLAAAHSDYCRSLRLTGTALTTFAAGEPLSVSDHTPAILLRSPSKSSRHRPPPPPPPKQPETVAFPNSHSPTVASSKLPHILSSSSHQRRKKKAAPAPTPAVKLPHILSDSSFTSSPKPHHDFFTYKAKPTSNYSNTPSQTSSVWNWENFYPPSPPDSEYFDQLKTNKHDSEEEDDKCSKISSHPGDFKKGFDFFEDDKASSYSSHSNYSRQSRNSNRRPAQPQPPPRNHLNRWESEDEDADVESERETEREEVQCSEWGDHDHCSTTSSSSGDEGAGGDTDFRSEVKSNAAVPGKVNVVGVNSAAKFSEKFSTSDGSSTASWGNNNNNFGKGDGEMVADRRIVVRHKDLVEIVNALREYFDKAADAGEQVSNMLEIGRAQLDRNFSKLKKTVYHSSGMLSNLSSSWTSKPPLAVKYRFEPGSLEESGCPKSLCSTLDRLLAWEKKLYQEVKAREGVKIDNEKKLSTLQSQEVRGDDEAKLDKTKASISRLQSLIVVTSQAVSTTSSAIIGLRDSELVPQLVELCHGFMYMWRSMNQFHEVQNDIVQQVRGLVNRATKGESTSDLHRQATRDLESAVSSWHSSFCRLIKFERDFIRSLHGWFKLTLVPVNSEQTNSSKEPSEVFAFCDEWKLALDRIPDTVASEAVKSFINVVHSISLKQGEELKIKKRTESAAKELEKKASSLGSIEKKYYNSYSMVGIGVPNTGPDDGHALDARDPLSEKKIELASCQRRVEDEMMKHARAVEVTRAMTLNNLQTGLPGVFQAMTSFSALITEALEAVCTRSYAIK